MDTKSKRSINHFALRCVAFLLCAAMAGGGIVMACFGMQSIRSKLNWDFSLVDLLSEKPYPETQRFRDKISYDAAQLMYLYNQYGGPEKIQADVKAGKLRETGTVDEAIANLYDCMDNTLYAMQTGQEEATTYDSGEFRIDAFDSGRVMLTLANLPGSVEGTVFDIEKMSTEAAVTGGLIVEVAKLFVNEETGETLPSSKSVRREMRPYADPKARATFEKIYAEELEAVRAQSTVALLSAWEEQATYFKNVGALYFIGSAEQKPITNVDVDSGNQMKDPAAFFTAAPGYISVLGDTIQGEPDPSGGTDSTDFSHWATGYREIVESGANADPDTSWVMSSEDGFSMYFTYTQRVFDTNSDTLQNTREVVKGRLIPAAILLLLSFILLILLIVLTGPRLAEGEGRRMYAFDKLFVEIQLGVVLGLLVALVVGIDVFFFYSIDASMVLGIGWVPVGIVAFLLMSAALWCFLSLVRNLKNGSFLRRSLIWLVLYGCYRLLKGLFLALKGGFDSRSAFSKIILLVVLFWFLTAIVTASIWRGQFAAMFVLLAILAAGIFFAYSRVKKFNALKKGIEEVSAGNLTYRIPVTEGKDEFDQLSRRINEIGLASNTAVQNELKNQRLKTDLISNVSHDLKTPLTSILTYTDLLKKEGLDSANAANYLTVIDEKSRRLEKLTEDLFEAAKASSGAIPVRREKVDLLSLINQALVEKSAGLESARLDMIVGKDDEQREHYYVNADSQLLWRVVENLLNNVQKYALEGSRVYIDVKEVTTGHGHHPVGAAPMIMLEVKNVSQARLNIPAGELMERFKRGDDSRSTEGSGLGLAIAKDLIHLQGGFFEIAIDGDLFKATSLLETWTASAE